MRLVIEVDQPHPAGWRGELRKVMNARNVDHERSYEIHKGDAATVCSGNTWLQNQSLCRGSFNLIWSCLTGEI